MDPRARLRLLEHAAAELLESETNGSLVLGVSGRDFEPLVVTALGCSVLVAVGCRSAVRMAVASLGRDRASGLRALAEGCDRTLREVHHLPSEFVPLISFGSPVNNARFAGRLG